MIYCKNFCKRSQCTPSTAIKKEKRLDPNLSTCRKINSERIKGLNVRPETLKLLEENTGKTLEYTGIGGLSE
jgi:hypothetical protein